MSKKVLITGANGGFGILTVESLLREGHQVAASMRNISTKNAEVAADMQSKGVKVVEIDVVDDHSVEQGVAAAIQALDGLDVVVNNAGLGVMGMQEHFTPSDMKYLFDVNVFGVQRVMRAALPFLRKQGNGLAIFVSSLLGRITLPFYGPYNASKWALEALAENYRTELSGFGIESVIVEPGGFPTTFMTNLMRPSDQSRDSEYGDFMQAPMAMAKGFEQALEHNTEQRPEKVAEAIVNLIELPFGERPFRTVVDHMGMGDHIDPYNQSLDQVTTGIYTAFGNEGMLKVKTS